jgi:hypothetical protein
MTKYGVIVRMPPSPSGKTKKWRYDCIEAENAEDAMSKAKDRVSELAYWRTHYGPNVRADRVRSLLGIADIWRV